MMDSVYIYNTSPLRLLSFIYMKDYKLLDVILIKNIVNLTGNPMDLKML